VTRDVLAQIADLESVVGGVIASIERRYFVFGGLVDRSEGPVDLTFRDNGTIGIDTESDGDSIVVSTQRWIDPLDDDLEPDKWTRFDVSGDDHYRDLIGCQLSAATPVFRWDGHVLGGVVFVTPHASMKVSNEGDVIWVTFPDAS
jgi:hypothetical protein